MESVQLWAVQGLFLVKLQVFTKTGRGRAYRKARYRVWFQLQAVVESVFNKTLGLRNKWQQRDSDRVSNFHFQLQVVIEFALGCDGVCFQ